MKSNSKYDLLNNSISNFPGGENNFKIQPKGLKQKIKIENFKTHGDTQSHSA